ncbi:MAG: diaminopimelate decarboxylase [bacterium]|nr:diaminopimelate decarboxylase [bacterium]
MIACRLPVEKGLPSGTIAAMAREPYDASCERALNALGWTDPELTIGGCRATQLADEFGSPSYVFCAATVDRQVARVRNSLGDRVELLYSIKSNPSLAVTHRLRERGVGAEIASLGELHVAVAAGHDPAELRFAGPGKTATELTAAIALGLGCVHAESADEVELTGQAARAAGRRVGVAVRVNLPTELAGSRLRMGGRSSRFGVDEDQVEPLLQQIARADADLELRGLHVYAGTQCFAAEAFVAHATAVVERAAAWESALGLSIDELDLGGGFGIAAYAGDPEFDLAAAGAGLQELIAAHDRPGRRWFVELGRYLVAPAGVYLTRVVRTKRSGGARHVVLDGGLHHCAMAAGVGAVLKRPPLLVHAGRPFASAREPVTIGGPLCTPADQFAADLDLPELTAGDLVAVLHAGAYGLTYSPTGFLSHPSPAELLVENGTARCIRDRGEPEDAVRGQRP